MEETYQSLKALTKTPNYKRKTFQQVFFVPTYRTNFDLPNNWFASRKEKFKKDLSWENFEFAVLRLKTGGNINSITFVGGEPLLWEHFDRAMQFCLAKKIVPSLNTDGFLIPKSYVPRKIKINLNTFFSVSEKDQQQILKNIETVYGKKRPRFLYYFSENDPFSRIEQVVALAKKYKSGVHLAPEIATPYSLKTKVLWIKSFDLVERELGQKLPFNFSIPTKFFSSAEKRKLSRDNVFSHNCDFCPLGKFLLNPDGKTIFPCAHLEMPSDISDFYGFGDFWEKQFLPSIRKKRKVQKEGCLAKTKGI